MFSRPNIFPPRLDAVLELDFGARGAGAAAADTMGIIGAALRLRFMKLRYPRWIAVAAPALRVALDRRIEDERRAGAAAEEDVNRPRVLRRDPEEVKRPRVLRRAPEEVRRAPEEVRRADPGRAW